VIKIGRVTMSVNITGPTLSSLLFEHCNADGDRVCFRPLCVYVTGAVLICIVKLLDDFPTYQLVVSQCVQACQLLRYNRSRYD